MRCRAAFFLSAFLPHRDPARKLWDLRTSFRVITSLFDPEPVENENSVGDTTAMRIVPEKLHWTGTVSAVEPRIRLLRSFSEMSHTYQGYTLIVDGRIGADDGQFRIGIGKALHAKHDFRIGDLLEGLCLPVQDPRRDSVTHYRVSRVKRRASGETVPHDGPPFQGIAPALTVYRERSRRRLAARKYSTKCFGCIWASKMAVEMLIDPWNPSYRYRTETFCYGPKSCRLYKAGRCRKVPGRKGMTWVEEDWVDEDATAHRGPDD